MKQNVFTLLCLGIFSINISAELKVIADLGGESAVRFYEPIQPVHSETAPKHPNAIPSQVTEEQLLPVVSHKWSVGKVQAKSLNLPGALPMFLIGADETSRQWLSQHRDDLVKMNAMGLVINVNTVDEMNILRNIVPELTLMPSPADTLAERLGIFHYPLLLTAEGISQ
ncbi:integrating conjugative element protein [Ursidibacter maritimus]|uniref:integrating conjugative element protein n=1 Tax=Ursidibacter maritimus TaxID=1331689 RepID=UPI001C443B51|nr:integrating conjugative element protein [Ursidibacter maritimus]MBV6540750.1 integrating conjugative element protein [Ursidibacter maritimus]